MLMTAAGGFAAMVKQFAHAASAGEFAVSPEGGEALLAAIRDMDLWVRNNLADLDMLGREQPLGSSNGAEVMKPYLRNVATDQQGFITQLLEFRATLIDAEKGITAAMANYDSTEQDIRGNFRAV